MSTFDVVLLTESRYEDPTEVDWYVENILTEDGLVQAALERQGLIVTRVDWARPDFDWSSTRCALFRTTWDYFHRFAEFDNWLEHVKSRTLLINPYEQVKWNQDKHYLRDLAAQGVNVTPTRYIPRGEKTTLADLHKETGWVKTVLKPTVSGAGRHTYKLTPDLWGQRETILQELLQHEDMMLQPFQEKVPTKGEVAYMVIGGEVTHAVLKKAKQGDFRVQDDFGGTVHDYTPSEKEVAFAEFAISKVDPLPAYARVDVIWDNDDQLAVSELELIEPEMWFRNCPEAADKLAEVVANILVPSTFTR